MSPSNPCAIIAEIVSSDRSDSETSQRLFSLLYEELRRLARRQLAQERTGLTQQPTALVHEAYLRLIENPDLRWGSRRKFFAAAARSMRQILVNRAIQKQTEKHGGRLSRKPFEEEMCVEEPAPDELLAIDEALALCARLPEERRVSSTSPSNSALVGRSL